MRGKIRNWCLWVSVCVCVCVVCVCVCVCVYVCVRAWVHYTVCCKSSTHLVKTRVLEGLLLPEAGTAGETLAQSADTRVADAKAANDPAKIRTRFFFCIRKRKTMHGK